MRGKGYFVSIPVGILVGLLAIGAVVGVGCLVWYKSPTHACPVRTDQERCDRYLELYGKEFVCQVDDEDEAKPPKVPEKEKVMGLRLNDTLAPYHYDVEMWPRLYGDFGFNGTVTMYMTCQKQTDAIVVQVDEVTVRNDSIQLKHTASGQTLTYFRVEEDVARHFYKIYLDTPLIPGMKYSLSMTFNGTLIHPDWRGFYRSSYIENNETHWLASTQFQRSHARRAFPCLDEPALKATFSVTLVRLQNYTSISNMPLLHSEPRGTDWVADVYQRTVVMPTYLLAFVISQFTYVSSTGPHGLPIRIWTRPTFLKYAEYANNYTGAFINALEQWTNISYVLPKLDQIAIPNFRSGAMENWGLVTYRETALLFNPDYSDNSDKRWVASVVAHELAHMWFGNLVTCNWWDDTFLNEGFATYFGDLVGMEGAMPKFEMDEFFLRRILYIMDKDGNAKSQPVFVADLEHHDDLTKAFDIITYYKGAAILRMVKYFLTERTYRTAIQNYLRKYEYSTVVHEDLYRELNAQAVRDQTQTWQYLQTNLSAIMDTWIEQQNYPIVTVSDPHDGKLTLTQSHFLYDMDEKIATPTNIGDEFIWDIPITYAYKSELIGSGMRDNLRIKWMHRKKTMDIDAGVGDWVLFNLDKQGYYRVKYGPNTWEALLTQLMQDHTVIPVQNRASLLDDAFRLAQADEFAEVEALRSTQYLRAETEYLPFSTYTGRTQTYLNLLYGETAHDELETYLRNLVLPAYKRLGWTVKEDNDAHLERYTRQITFRQACLRNYKPCVDRAKALFEQWMSNPDINPIHPDLRPLVYCTAVARGGNQEWNFLLDRYQQVVHDVYTAYENGTLKAALSCPTMPHVIRKYLDYALSLNSTTLFTAISGDRHARDTAWNYINEHWDEFKDGNTTRIKQASVLSSVAGSWSSETDLQKLEAFMAAHPDPELTKEFVKVKEKVKKNRTWMEANLDPIHQWLLQVNAGNATTGTPQLRRRRRRSMGTDIDFTRGEFAEVRLRSEF